MTAVSIVSGSLEFDPEANESPRMVTIVLSRDVTENYVTGLRPYEQRS